LPAPLVSRTTHQAQARVTRSVGLGSARVGRGALHFVQAGETSRGVTHALAGERALRAYSEAEAVGYFRAAVGLRERGGDEGRRATALVGLGEAATLAADHSEAAQS